MGGDLEKFETSLLLLDAVAAELTNPSVQTLEDAKTVIDNWRLLFNICIQLEKGNAEAFVAEIKKLCETDPRKALEFALGGAREKLEKVKLEN
jgi:hypothetical protein